MSCACHALTAVGMVLDDSHPTQSTRFPPRAGKVLRCNPHGSGRTKYFRSPHRRPGLWRFCRRASELRCMVSVRRGAVKQAFFSLSANCACFIFHVESDMLMCEGYRYTPKTTLTQNQRPYWCMSRIRSTYLIKINKNSKMRATISEALYCRNMHD